MNLPVQKARGTPRAPGAMNKTEARYAALLDARIAAGEVLWWMFEGIALRLAEHKCFYHPDFLVMLADCTLEIHETKGAFIREDSAIKLKVAASLFPLVFRRCVWDKGEWTITVVGKASTQPRSVKAAAPKPAALAPVKQRRELVAYLDGKPIPYDEARKLIGQ